MKLELDYEAQAAFDQIKYALQNVGNIGTEINALTLAIQELNKNLTEVKRVAALLNRNKDETV